MFDDINAGMANELLIHGRKLHIFIVFITQSHFASPKDVRFLFDPTERALEKQTESTE